ncbi:MAG: hypothetical protein IKG87_04705 [Clostridia bacterium]|nr:hypothetical protein [Clostridia bacterium]
MFRKAEKSEAEAIRALYQAVIGTPFCTWDESYPGETEIAETGSYHISVPGHQAKGTVSFSRIPGSQG